MGFFVGLPVSAETVKEKGIQQTLDLLSAARVNALILNAHNGDGAHYRYDEAEYAFTRLKPFSGCREDYDGDLLGQVIEAAGKRNMQVYSHTMLYENGLPGMWPAGTGRETISHQLRNFTDCAQIDLFGRRNIRP